VLSHACACGGRAAPPPRTWAKHGAHLASSGTVRTSRILWYCVHIANPLVLCEYPTSQTKNLSTTLNL